jgi:chromosome partitioning protein
MDSQANLSEMFLGGEIEELIDENIIAGTVFDAFKEMNAKKYIVNVAPNLDLLPSDEYLAAFSRWLFQEYAPKGSGKDHNMALRNLLEPLQDIYDFILIDTPPALSDQTLNALSCSDGVIVLFEPSLFSYRAIHRFMDTIEAAKETTNPNLRVLGILTCLLDMRRRDNVAMLRAVKDQFPGLMFETRIRRKAAIGRLPLDGFVNNPEIIDAVEQYAEFVDKELLPRVAQQRI